MRTMAIHLENDEDIEDVVAYISSLSGRGKHIGISGNIKAGESSYAVCVSCHGANGEGNKALNAPSCYWFECGCNVFCFHVGTGARASPNLNQLFLLRELY